MVDLSIAMLNYQRVSGYLMTQLFGISGYLMINHLKLFMLFEITKCLWRLFQISQNPSHKCPIQFNIQWFNGIFGIR